MNGWFLAAAALSALLGLAHSFLGERFIFDRQRRGETASQDLQKMLAGRHGAAIRSTWHLATLFGFGLAGLFVWMAYPGRDVQGLGVGIAGFLLCSALYWLIGTRGRHPAWAVFLAIAALAYLGSG